MRSPACCVRRVEDVLGSRFAAHRFGNLSATLRIAGLLDGLLAHGIAKLCHVFTVQPARPLRDGVHA
jgi:hypothetical protein